MKIASNAAERFVVRRLLHLTQRAIRQLVNPWKKEERQMKREIKLALSAAIVAGVATVGPAFGLNRSDNKQAPGTSSIPRLTTQSVIKVHTYRGVITLPGDSGPSWDELEKAVFVADSIADFQFANGEIPGRISNE